MRAGRPTRARRPIRRGRRDRCTCKCRHRKTRPGRRRWRNSSPARDSRRACCSPRIPTTATVSCSGPTPRAPRPRASAASSAAPSGSTSRRRDRPPPATLAPRRAGAVAGHRTGAHRAGAGDRGPEVGGGSRVGRGPRRGAHRDRRARALPHARPGRGHRPQARPPLLDLPADAVTVRPLPRSRLDALVPSLVTGQALIALVPATGDLKWAAGAAWDVARAAALTEIGVLGPYPTRAQAEGIGRKLGRPFWIYQPTP